jgi:hypothetical protein
MRALAIAAAILAGAGCTRSFDPAALVDKLRLLAVKAEPPEVAPGHETTMTATFANAGGSTPTVTWDACLLPPPPASGETVNVDCVGLDSGDKLLHFGDGPSVTATLPMLTLNDVGPPDQTNGFYLPVRLRLDADGQSLVAFYSLRIYPGPFSPNPPNHNPTLIDIFTVPSAGAGADQQTALGDLPPVTVTAHDTVALRALLTPDSAETYQVFDGDPRTTPPRSVTEVIRVSWFSTAGSFSNEATGIDKPDTTLTLDQHLPPSGTPIDLWAVARDERGGSDVVHRRLLFR